MSILRPSPRKAGKCRRDFLLSLADRRYPAGRNADRTSGPNANWRFSGGGRFSENFRAGKVGAWNASDVARQVELRKVLQYCDVAT